MVGAAPTQSNTPATSSSKQTDMAMTGHACCKARHRALANKPSAGSDLDDNATTVTLPEDPSPDGANSCCPLTSGSFVIVSRSQTNDDNSIALAEEGLHEARLAVPLSAHRPFPQRLPNHEHTYLTCCVFLI
jgi:hypothetical protein